VKKAEGRKREVGSEVRTTRKGDESLILLGGEDV
jgi:hypothetical protein